MIQTGYAIIAFPNLRFTMQKRSDDINRDKEMILVTKKSGRFIMMDTMMITMTTL